LKKLILALLVLLPLSSACEEETPTAVSESLFPVAPRTLEVHIPWGQFATTAEVFGDFGEPYNLRQGVLSNNYKGGLSARMLVRWGNLRAAQSVRDSTGTTVVDSIFTYLGGTLLVRFDTLSSTRHAPALVAAQRILPAWHPPSATWEFAVDSAGDRRPWPEVGGGPAQPIILGEWDPITGDSLVLPVDPLTLTAWADTLDVGKGLRLDMVSQDARLEVVSVQLRYEVIPSVNPDTTLVRTADPQDFTFIYTPEPGPPEDGLRVGGVPAWRTFIRMQVPDELMGPPALCEVLGCPFQLRPERINHAALVFETLPSVPPGFEPIDSVRLDVRSVLAPDRVPRSPLGPSFSGTGARALPPELFGDGAPRQVSVPFTEFVIAQLADAARGGTEPPTALAILALPEPSSIAFAAFAGPGGPGAPFLRLIVTGSAPVELP